VPEDGYGMPAAELHKPDRRGGEVLDVVYQPLAQLRVAIIVNELHPLVHRSIKLPLAVIIWLAGYLLQ
jgi:hypothetical protein